MPLEITALAQEVYEQRSHLGAGFDQNYLSLPINRVSDILNTIHLIKPCLKKPLWVMQCKVLRMDLNITFHVQNIPGYKATLQVLASVCTIYSNATSSRNCCIFSLVSVMFWVIISLNELHIVLEKCNPPIIL